MKTNLYDLRFGTYRKSEISTKNSSQDEEFDEDEDNTPWICCKCGNGNGGEVSLCDDCAHDRCSHCTEY